MLQGHFPCPTTAGSSLSMLGRHVEGRCRFYGTLVEGANGPRRLSLWEIGASMGTVPLPWPTHEPGRWLNAVGNAIPAVIPGQILQALLEVGGHPGQALRYACQQRERQRRSLPVEVVDSVWTRQGLICGGEEHWENLQAICVLVASFAGHLSREAAWAIQLCLAHGCMLCRPQRGIVRLRSGKKKKKAPRHLVWQ